MGKSKILFSETELASLGLAPTLRDPYLVFEALTKSGKDKDLWLALALASGKYPSRIQFQQTKELLKTQQKNVIGVLTRKFPKVSVKFRFATENIFCFNVTNTIYYPYMTGIQRIVRDFYRYADGEGFLPVAWNPSRDGLHTLSDHEQFLIEKWWKPEIQTFKVKLGLSVHKYLHRTYRKIANFRIFQVILNKTPLGRKLVKKLKQFQAWVVNSKVKPELILPLNPTYVELEANADIDSIDRLLLMKNVGLLKASVFCHDILPISHPELFPKDPNYDSLAFASLLTAADSIFVGSSLLSDEIQSKLGELSTISILDGLPISQLPSNTSSNTRKEIPLPKVCVIGTIEPRKNHLLILAACELLWDEGYEFQLNIIGNRGWLSDDIELTIKTLISAERPLNWLQGVSDEEMREELQSSLFSIYVPIAEGWGLPPVENAMLGKLTVTSRIPSAVWLQRKNPKLVMILEETNTFELVKVLKQAFSQPLDNLGELMHSTSESWYETYRSQLIKLHGN